MLIKIVEHFVPNDCKILSFFLVTGAWGFSKFANNFDQHQYEFVCVFRVFFLFFQFGIFLKTMFFWNSAGGAEQHLKLPFGIPVTVCRWCWATRWICFENGLIPAVHLYHPPGPKRTKGPKETTKKTCQQEENCRFCCPKAPENERPKNLSAGRELTFFFKKNAKFVDSLPADKSKNKFLVCQQVSFCRF